MTQFKPVTDKHEVIAEVCHAIEAGDLDRARAVLKERYRFVPRYEPYFERAKPVDGYKHVKKEERKRKNRSEEVELKICKQNYFTDRYTGQKLVYKKVLELITHWLPDAFPVSVNVVRRRRNWKLTGTHLAYYDLWPSIEHIEPFSREGADTMDNLVTASWVNNEIKHNYRLKEIGEQLLPIGEIEEWDGLLGWYQAYETAHPEVVEQAQKSWLQRALARAS